MAMNVNWRLGYPEEEGGYLVTYKSPCGTFTEFSIFQDGCWDIFETSNFRVVAWLPLSDIKPYIQNHGNISTDDW